MFSQTVEYALRAVVWLAAHELAQTNQQIAHATKVPAGYLAKVMQALGRGGVVSAHRGKRGGFALAKPSREMTVLEVINAVERVQRIRECPLGIQSHGNRLCPLHAKLDGAMAGLEKAFGETTIFDIVAEPSQSPPLCHIAGVGNVA